MASQPLYLGLWFMIALFHISTAEVANETSAGLEFVTQPQDAVGRRRAPLVLNCSARGDADAGAITYTWRRDDQDVTQFNTSNHLRVHSNGSLSFVTFKRRKVKAGDEGVYWCLASNQYGTIISRPAHVRSAVLLRFSEEPGNVTAISGQSVFLKCHITGTPEPTITWKKNKRALPVDDDRFTVLPTGQLHIHAVTAADGGRYSCHASNLVRDRNSREGTLTILPNQGSVVPAKIVVLPQSKVVTVGDTVVLVCGVTGLPKPVVTWRFTNGSPVPLNNHVSLIDNSSLKIQDVSRSHNNIYNCSAEQSGGHIVSAKANVTVLVPPLPDYEEGEERQTVLKFRLAQPIKLECKIWGHPAPKMTWLKNGHKVVSQGRTRIVEEDYMLHIVASSTKDAGFYQCLAENPAGVLIQSTLVHIEVHAGAPNIPVLEGGRAVSRSHVSLWWTPSAGETPIIAYSVHYEDVSKASGKEFQKVVQQQTDSQEMSTHIDQLTAYTNYSFYIVAYNSEGASPSSNQIFIVTDQDIPSETPELNIKPAGSTTLLLEWQPLSKLALRGQLQGYHILYQPADTSQHSSGGMKQLSRPPNENSFLLTGLEPSTVYDICVIAGTKAGYQHPDDVPYSSQQTNAPRIDGAPEPPALHVHSYKSTSMTVTWGYSSRADGYILSHKPLRNPSAPWTERAIGSMRFIIQGLQPKTSYDVRLVAYNKQGESDPIIQHGRTLAHDNSTSMPGSHMSSPFSLKVSALNQTSMRVSWKDPNHPPLPQSVYRLRYISKQRLESRTPQYTYLRMNNMTVDIYGLLPNTIYIFSVQILHPQKGNSSFSSPVSKCTLEGVPSAPRNAQVMIRGPSTVTLTWEPPEKQNGIIISYVIFYSPEFEQAMWNKRKENGSVTQTLVDKLEKGTLYYFKLRAATQAGEGPDTSIFQVKTEQETLLKERDIGIIIGVCIGVGCIIICAIIILLRNRCCPVVHHPVPILPLANGNATIPNGCTQHSALLALRDRSDEATPMLIDKFLDTKGDGDGKPLCMHGFNSRHNGGSQGIYIPPNGTGNHVGRPHVHAKLMSNGDVRPLCYGFTSRHNTGNQNTDNSSKPPEKPNPYSSMEDIDRSCSNSQDEGELTPSHPDRRPEQNLDHLQREGEDGGERGVCGCGDERGEAEGGSDEQAQMVSMGRGSSNGGGHKGDEPVSRDSDRVNSSVERDRRPSESPESAAAQPTHCSSTTPCRPLSTESQCSSAGDGLVSTSCHAPLGDALCASSGTTTDTAAVDATETSQHSLHLGENATSSPLRHAQEGRHSPQLPSAAGLKAVNT